LGGTGLGLGMIGGATLGAEGGTMILPLFGTVVLGGGGAVVGGTAGLLAGSMVGAARDMGSLVKMSGLGDKIKRKIARTIETAGLVIGLMTGDSPPPKPDPDKDKPIPPVPTSTKSVLPGQRNDGDRTP
jgi:hypothetical protein